MKLASFLNPALVFCRLQGETREELYTNMLEQAQGQLREKVVIPDVVKELIEREDALKIPYEQVAIPHVRLNCLHDLYILIGIPEKPQKLTADGTEPVRVIVMSLISESTSASYLKALAAFSRYLAQPGKIDRLTACTDGLEVISVLAEDNVLINRNITAEDLMCSDYPVIRADASLASALDTFYRERRQVLPVVDSDNKLLGVIDATEVIKSFIPEYIFMMDNLNFLNSFEVFENIFKAENKFSVKDFVHPAKMVLAPSTPLIQFTIRLVRREAYAGFVVDKEGRLLGVVGIGSIVHKVLRG